MTICGIIAATDNKRAHGAELLVPLTTKERTTPRLLQVLTGLHLELKACNWKFELLEQKQAPKTTLSEVLLFFGAVYMGIHGRSGCVGWLSGTNSLGQQPQMLQRQQN